MNKTVRIFLAEVDGPVVVTVSDHADYAWLRADDRAGLVAAVAQGRQAAAQPGAPSLLAHAATWAASRRSISRASCM